MGRVTMVRVLIAVVAVALSASALSGQATQPRMFEVPAHGALRLPVPDSWVADARPIQTPPSTALHFVPKAGDDFDVRVTSVWLDPSKRAKTTSESIRKDMQKAGNKLLSQSVEKSVTLREIQGKASIGWSYALTDRNPGPGEFRFLTQGAFLTGEVLSAFTVLHRSADNAGVIEALEVFGDAIHAK